MKRIFILITVALVVLTSCKKGDEPTPSFDYLTELKNYVNQTEEGIARNGCYEVVTKDHNGLPSDTVLLFDNIYKPHMICKGVADLSNPDSICIYRDEWNQQVWLHKRK